jgi:hypothetical protein
VLKSERVYPASFAQQQLWLIEQLGISPGLYNCGLALVLDGNLDVSALSCAFVRVVDRHASLRTRLGRVGAEVVQYVSDNGPTLAHVDVAELDEAARAARVAELEAELTQRPFDLERGPLLRAVLLRLGESRHRLVLAMHHIITDQRSRELLVGELVFGYAALLRGEVVPLPELPLSYGEFASWQRSSLDGPRLTARVEQWTAGLRGLGDPVTLPPDRARLALPRYRGAQRSFKLVPELTAGVYRIARSARCTPFIVALTALGAILYRCSGRSDIVVGCPVANRTTPEVEDIIGCFVNLLPIRLRLDGGWTLGAALVAVRSSAINAYAHQDLPLEAIVRAVRPAREGSRTPLVRVVLAFEGPPAKLPEMPGIVLRCEELVTGTAKFDLTVSLRDLGGALVGTVEYDTDLYDDATIVEFIGALERVLARLTSDPECHVSDLPPTASHDAEPMGENDRRETFLFERVERRR